MRPLLRLLAFAAAAVSGCAQVTLSTVAGGVVSPTGQVYTFGSVGLGSVADATFRLTNTGGDAVYLSQLSVAGTSLETPPYTQYFSVACGLSPDLCGAASHQQLPVLINPTGTLDFTVQFEPFELGSPSATMAICAAAVCEGNTISVFLTGTGTPGLTALVGNQPLATGQSIGFGEVQAGLSKTIAVMLANRGSASLAVPAISVTPAGAFTLSGSAHAGTSVAPGASAELDVTFAPAAVGDQQATLSIGLLTYPLEGTATTPPPPHFPAPMVDVNLATTASAQQGSIAVSLASDADTDGTGAVTLAFESAVNGAADDPKVIFADGTRRAALAVTKGSAAAQFSGGITSVAFQTGTTAGTLTFSVTLGDQTAQTRVVIPAAAIGLDAAVAARNVSCDSSVFYCTATNIQMQLNGWDNTRSASAMTFTFFDASGNAIAPGAITVNSASAFSSYFGASDLAGVFGVSAFFPITGDANQVVAAKVVMTNSVGSVSSAKITF